jgi:hypothetical protein
VPKTVPAGVLARICLTGPLLIVAYMPATDDEMRSKYQTFVLLVSNG